MPVPPTPPVTSAPIDPATMSGVRDNPLYIGATNFSTLQKQYTPYQIEQATTRDASGNIFWKQGMDIKNVPTSAPSATLAPPATKPPMPTSVAAVPAPTLTAPPATSAEFQARNTAAQTYLTGLDASIDNIRKEQEMRLAAQKVEQEKTVDTLKGKLSEMMNGTQYQDSLKRDRELFQVEQQVRDLGEIRSKIADAQNALTQGLIFEEGRPTRMELLTGRSAELKKQGLAHVQALQSTAEIIKGNIDLARAYANDSIDALRRDNEQKIGALNTLLDLENKKLTTLSEDEKATVKERMNALKEESDRITEEKDKVFDFATKYPQAFSKGGVTFRDTLEQAIQKMLPHLSEYEKIELQKKQLELAEIQSRIDENKAQAKKASSSGGGSSGALASLDGQLKSIANQAFIEGKTLNEMIADLGGPSVFTKKQLDELQDFWSTFQKEKPQNPAPIDDLFSLGIDPTQRPELIGKSLQDIAKVMQEERSAAQKKAEEDKKIDWVNQVRNWAARKIEP